MTHEMILGFVGFWLGAFAWNYIKRLGYKEGYKDGLHDRKDELKKKGLL